MFVVCFFFQKDTSSIKHKSERLSQGKYILKVYTIEE